jgi:hypothetical protein
MIQKPFISTDRTTSKYCNETILVDRCLFCNFLCNFVLIILDDTYLDAAVSICMLYSQSTLTKSVNPYVLKSDGSCNPNSILNCIRQCIDVYPSSVRC